MKSKLANHSLKGRMNNSGFRAAVVILTIALLCLLTSCEFNPLKKSENTVSNLKKTITRSISSTPIGESDFSGPMDTWSSDALRLSFQFPAEGRVVVDPDLNQTLRIEYTQDLTVGLFVKPAAASKPSEFKKAMQTEMDEMPGYTGGFKEFRRKFFTMSLLRNTVTGPGWQTGKTSNATSAISCRWL